ncbi:leucyl/phenylalanyl-tRNA--protein transferase [Terrarubrum flagellatum]|uniref:leucyl/phenylalanyl-tRNA--protein transferase n=1 Tax=Terrirubrum flagellatum TaxID=2895980 RepID=UPI003144EDE1
MSRSEEAVSITPDILLRAYAAGVFPMAESADDPGLYWVEPKARGIIPLDGLIVSRSLAKAVKQDRFRIRVDHDFDAVITACAEAKSDRPNTWINARIRQLYRALFDQGNAHTIECWRDDALVGGLYGVSLGGVFFGESMFHRASDASKVALVHLVARLRRGCYRLLDAQFITDHLASLGAVEISRARYKRLLAEAVVTRPLPDTWSEAEPINGAEALAILRGE